MDIDVIPTALPGVVIIRTDYFRDERGYFIESYHKQRYVEHGLDYEFVQDNHSRSGERVLRGIHYQDMPAPMGGSGAMSTCAAGRAMISAKAPPLIAMAAARALGERRPGATG